MLPGGKAFLTTSTVLVDAVPSTVVTNWCTVAKDSKAHNSVTLTLPNSQERLRSLRRRSCAGRRRAGGIDALDATVARRPVHNEEGTETHRDHEVFRI